MCYQRLSRDDNGPPYTLHGLNAVWLSNQSWYRLDPRGNRPGIDAQFTPLVEKIAFPIVWPGEGDLPEVWSEPLPVVVEALQSAGSADELWQHLPDVALWASTTPPQA